MDAERNTSDKGNGRALTWLLVGGAAVGIAIYRAVMLKRWVAEQMRDVPPADPTVVAQQFEGIPLHPGAELERKGTAEGVRAAAIAGHMWPAGATGWVAQRLFGLGPGALQETVTAAFTVDASPTDVMAWYDVALAEGGWARSGLPGLEGERPRIIPRPLYGRRSAYQALERVYRRGAEQLTVVASMEGGSGPTALVLSRAPIPPAV